MGYWPEMSEYACCNHVSEKPVLTDAQVIFIAQQLPSPKATIGRPAYSNQELLPGILRVLRSGCRWRDLNLPGYPDGSTHWRRLRLWRKGLHFRWLWKRILKLLDEQNPAEKERRFQRLSIDGTLLQSRSIYRSL